MKLLSALPLLAALLASHVHADEAANPASAPAASSASAAASAASADSNPAATPTPTPAPATEAVASAPSAPLQIKEVRAGHGREATAGHDVEVHYTGWLYNPKAKDGHGRKFDSSVGRALFRFPLGAGRVIKGWDQGVAGMKEGGKRTLIIPPELAYGKRNIGNGLIPPDSTLLFEVELFKVHD